MMDGEERVSLDGIGEPERENIQAHEDGPYGERIS